jgi:hypothetical protein
MSVAILLLTLSLSTDLESEMLEDTFRQTLTDVDRNINLGSWSIGSDELTPGADTRWRIEKDVLHGGRQEGVDRIRVHNGALSFTIIPTRGMNVWDARCGDLRLGWDSPVKEVVHPQYVNLSERGGLGWLTGFGEWINRCGLASNGAPGIDEVPSNTGASVAVDLTLHGKVTYLPARKVEVIVEPGSGAGDKAVIRIRGVVDETMMYGTQLRLISEISTVVGSRTLTVNDEVQNLSAADQEFQLLYHTNFGPPLLGDGATLVAPALRVIPRDVRAAEGGMERWNLYGPPTAGYTEQVYFLKLAANAAGDTEVLLKNPTGDRGVVLDFSTRGLPYMTVWKNTGALENGYVTGLEPATNYPNNRSFERKNGRVPVLKGGESHKMRLSISALLSAEEVAQAAARVQKLLGGSQTEIASEPVAGVSP